MRLFILSANPETYFGVYEMRRLRKSFNSVTVLTKGFVEDEQILTSNQDPCIVALDPDYDHWRFGKKGDRLNFQLKSGLFTDQLI